MVNERFLQIDKGHCGGDRNLFDSIKDVLHESKKFKVTEDPVVFTIIEIPTEQTRLGEIEENKEKEEDYKEEGEVKAKELLDDLKKKEGENDGDDNRRDD